MAQKDEYELYKKHRPTKFSEVFGQDAAIASLQSMAKSRKFPRFLLMVGPSGSGKTTIAYILKEKLKVHDRDFIEVDAATNNGIDFVREIKKHAGLKPLGGGDRIWLIDECQNLTPQAQEAFLKLLENTPKHVYFIFATTDPQKLKRTIRTRATEIKVRALKKSEMSEMLDGIAEKEETTLSATVKTKLFDSSEGSPRKALVLLNAVINLESDEDKVDAIDKADSSEEHFQLCFMLLGGSKWSDVANVLKDVQKNDVEGIRWMILAYMSSVAIKNTGAKAERAATVIEAFQDNFYDSGKAGLVQACMVCCGS